MSTSSNASTKISAAHTWTPTGGRGSDDCQNAVTGLWVLAIHNGPRTHQIRCSARTCGDRTVQAQLHGDGEKEISAYSYTGGSTERGRHSTAGSNNCRHRVGFPQS
jgi:hypothetical protein